MDHVAFLPVLLIPQHGQSSSFRMPHAMSLQYRAIDYTRLSWPGTMEPMIREPEFILYPTIGVQYMIMLERGSYS
jgi:hypothetical protein